MVPSSYRGDVLNGESNQVTEGSAHSCYLSSRYTGHLYSHYM